MKKSVNRSVGVVLVLLMMASMLCVSAAATQQPTVEPRYTGITQLYVDLEINSAGKASCYTRVTPKSGYSVDLTMKLLRDGSAIKTWSASGEGIFSMDKVYYVTPGHDYQVTVSADVWNSSGKLVETPTIQSDVHAY